LLSALALSVGWGGRHGHAAVIAIRLPKVSSSVLLVVYLSMLDVDVVRMSVVRILYDQ
jgi:hypothetical protein